MPEPFVGEIRMGAFNLAPSGWMFCRGQILPIAQNAGLYSVLGTRFGGDGVTTFGLPNLSERVPLGAGTGPGLPPFGLGESGGQATVALNASHLPAHTHQLFGSNVAALNQVPDGTELLGVANVRTYAPAQNLVETQGTTTVGGAPHENRQPYLALTFIIAVQGIDPVRP